MQHYLDLKDYVNAISYGLLYEADDDANKGVVRLLVMRAASEEAAEALQNDRLKLIDKAIELYEDFVKKGWSGPEKDEGEKIYNDLLLKKKKLTNQTK